jgi:hypothetical protein
MTRDECIEHMRSQLGAGIDFFGSALGRLSDPAVRDWSHIRWCFWIAAQDIASAFTWLAIADDPSKRLLDHEEP